MLPHIQRYEDRKLTKGDLVRALNEGGYPMKSNELIDWYFIKQNDSGKSCYRITYPDTNSANSVGMGHIYISRKGDKLTAEY